MIGRLRGVLVEKNPPYLLVDVNGVGYQPRAPMTTIYDLPDIGGEVVLHTVLIVRDDALELFAFSTPDQRRWFELLIKVNGVGTRMALAILSGLPVADLIRCLNAGDVSGLTDIPGIGKKTAERLLIELRDRMEGMETTPTETSDNHGNQSSGEARTDAISALVALGYNRREAIERVDKAARPDMKREEIIRNALHHSKSR